MQLGNLLAESRPHLNRRAEAGGNYLEVEDVKEVKELEDKTLQIRLRLGDFSFPLLPSFPLRPLLPFLGAQNR